MSEREDVWVKSLGTDELGPVPGFKGVWKRYVNPGHESQKLIFAMGMLQPGEDAGWHAHPEEEVFYVLSGRGRALWRIGEEIYEAELAPGKAFFKRSGIPHQLENTGSEPLIGIACKV